MALAKAVAQQSLRAGQAARFGQPPYQLFDATTAASVARPPLDAEDVLIARLAGPRHSTDERHGNLGARRSNFEHDQGPVGDERSRQHEGAAAADVAQRALQPRGAIHRVPRDGKLDRYPLVASAAAHRCTRAGAFEQIFALGLLARQKLDADAGANLEQVAPRPSPGHLSVDQHGRLPPTESDFDRHQIASLQFAPGWAEDTPMAARGLVAGPKFLRVLDDELGRDPLGRGIAVVLAERGLFVEGRHAGARGGG